MTASLFSRLLQSALPLALSGFSSVACAIPTVLYSDGTSTITLESASTPSGACGTSDQSSNPLASKEVLAACGYPETTPELYKQNRGGTEVGAYAPSYTTSFNTYGPGAGFNDALLQWVTGQDYLDCSGCILFLKDGNASPNAYGFNISNWDGKSSIVMTGFFDDSLNSGNADYSISHLSIYGAGSRIPPCTVDCGGGPGGGPNVPEPATLALVSLGLLGTAWSKRKRLSK